MKLNFGFLWAKLLKLLNRPALRDCTIDRTARVGAGSNCIRVTMGRYSYMGAGNAVCDAQIGAFCSVADHCFIGGGMHDMACVSTSPVFHKGRNILGVHLAQLPEVQAPPVQIGNDVWIGEAAFICPGVRIGDGAVIGAHSVVTHDVPPYTVAAGAPARPIRERFDVHTAARLQASEWWTWPEERLRSADFSSPEAFFGAEEETRE